jgi:hypothetical protein
MTNLESLTQPPIPTVLTPENYFENLVQAAAEAVQTCRASCRKAAMDYVAAGRALMAVKDELLDPAYRSQPREDGQFAVRDNVSLTAEKGWQALCAERLGISYKTADRYIDDAVAYDLLSADAQTLPRAQEYLDAVESGEVRAGLALQALLEYKALPEKGELDIDPRTWAGLEARCKTQAELVRFREMETAALAGDELAANGLAQAAKGNIPIARAYAGWRGGVATKDKARHDPDYTKLLIKSSSTLLNAWKRYYDMPTEARRAASDALVCVMSAPDLPEEVGRELYNRLAERFGGQKTK